MSTLHPSHPVTIDRPPRHLSATTIKNGGVLPMLWRQITAEFLKQWRLPIFSISTIGFPVFFFIIFGLPNARQTLPDGTSVGRYVMASMSAYGLLGIAFFSFGIGVAVERGQGWMKLIKATPMPSWVYFVARMVMALLFALIICLVLFPVAIVGGGVRMPVTQWLTLTISLLLGLLPFTTIGFAIGYWVGPNSAGPIAQFGYFLLSFASGLWIPLTQLPRFVQTIAPYLPTYHYAQIAWRAVGADDGKFGTHVLWLISTTLVFGALAVWGYRHDQGQQYG
jgi:ABC-2 type transport system permease protein